MAAFFKADLGTFSAPVTVDLNGIDWGGGLLVRSTNWLGDAVMALPGVYRLKEALPAEVKLTIVCPAKLAALWRSVTWIDEGGTGAGMQACVVAGAPVRYLEREGRHVGAVWEDEHAHHCWLGDVSAADPSLSREAQVRATFEGIEEALGLAGMGFDHLVRTWLFIDRILDWYGPFNAARTQFFEERGVFDRFLPASTGIGAANPAGRSVVAQAIALQPKGAGVEVREVESPLQCPATEYRSSFSRAAEVVRGGVRQVYVSGTASIDLCGDTVHEGDLYRQIGHTMEVVEAILGTHGLGWANVSRGIVYFKEGYQASGFERYCRERDLPPLPVIVTQGTVCRDDLLFEIEVDAIGT